MRRTPEEEALVLPPGTEGTSLASFTGGADFASGPGGVKFSLLPGGAVILMPREPVLRLGSARSSVVAANSAAVRTQGLLACRPHVPRRSMSGFLNLGGQVVRL